LKFQNQVFHVEKNFYRNSQQLRDYFELQFRDPRQTQAERFVWDYWHVKNQYCQLRTPAYNYFPEKIYYPFHEHLVKWGRENLGCHDVSPPWLSYYVNGHFQNLHSDMPHGPWAYVYSLSPKKIKFDGGQTLMLKDSVLNFWSGDRAGSAEHEMSEFFHEVTPYFGQLLIFDSRIPHAVKEVKNILDPIDARLVIHGWFVEPRPFVVGGLKTNQVTKAIDGWLPDLQEWLYQQTDIQGCLTVKLFVNPSGVVQDLFFQTNTVRLMGSSQQSVGAVKHLLKFVRASMQNLKFPNAAQKSEIVIPLLFK
jgi:hypothetical protein